jgi:hypothetical protein
VIFCFITYFLNPGSTPISVTKKDRKIMINQTSLAIVLAIIYIMLGPRFTDLVVLFITTHVTGEHVQLLQNKCLKHVKKDE